MSKRIFLTGANGYLGSHIAVRLAEQGYRITALVRKGVSAPLLQGCSLDICTGDLRDPRTYETALKKCDMVIHTAAITAFSLRDTREYYDVNWKATAVLLDRAFHFGIRRFIHAGTRGTLGTAGVAAESDEGCLDREIKDGEDYLRSKYLAETAVKKYAREGKMSCLILSPTALVGAYDYKPSPAGAVISSFLKGRIYFYMDGGINIVDVEDAAQAFVNALERGANGETYILGNKNITLYELFRELSSVSGTSRMLVKVPFPLAYAASWGIEGLCKALCRPVFVTRHKVISLYDNCSYCSSKKAVSVLGLPQTPVRNTLEKAVVWFRQNR